MKANQSHDAYQEESYGPERQPDIGGVELVPHKPLPGNEVIGPDVWNMRDQHKNDDQPEGRAPASDELQPAVQGDNRNGAYRKARQAKLGNDTEQCFQPCRSPQAVRALECNQQPFRQRRYPTSKRSSRDSRMKPALPVLGSPLNVHLTYQG